MLAAALALAGAAAADPPPLYVTFRPDHSFFVYLPNGTQVGTTNGAASVIAAGSYTLLLDDTAAVDMPFDLSGPGVKLVTDMAHAEEVSDAVVVTFQPNSTYTYRDDNHPNVFWTLHDLLAGAPAVPDDDDHLLELHRPDQDDGNGRHRRLADGDRAGLACRRRKCCRQARSDLQGQGRRHAESGELQADRPRPELEPGLHCAARP